MRKDTYKDSGGSLNTKQLYAISDRIREIGHIEDEVMSPRDDNFTAGIVSGIVASDAGSGVLSLTSGVFYHTNGTSGFLERVEFAGDTIDLSSEPDNTYYVYLISQEDTNADAYAVDKYLPIGDKFHRHLDYSEVLSYSTNSGESKIKVCSVNVASSVITGIDATFRTRYELKNSLEYQIDEKITQRILDVDEDPVINILNTPPGSPSDGDRYIVDSSPTGAWVGHTDDITTYDSGSTSWMFNTPVEGTTVWNQTSNSYIFYDGGVWIDWEGKISFDEIPDGTNYGKIRTVPTTQLNSAGNANTVLLRQSTGGYADTVYGKVTDDHLDYSRHRPVTYVIAANNSKTSEKECADYVCDGTADEVEINTALALMTNGGVLILLPGTFYLAGDITISYPYTTIEGSCRVGTSISAGGYSIRNNGNDYVVLSDFTFSSNSGTTQMIYFTNTDNCIISNIVINNTTTNKDSIFFETSASNNLIENCNITNSSVSPSAAIYFPTTGSNNKIINNTVDGNSILNKSCIVCGTDNSIITHNYCFDSLSGGISNTADYNIITENIIKNIGNDGIYNTGMYCNISNNVLDDINNYSIENTGLQTNIIGNNITSNSLSSGSRNINNTANYVTILNNNCRNAEDYGIYNSGTDCNIDDNLVNTVVSNSGIYNSGADCNIQNNNIYNPGNYSIYNSGNYNVISGNIIDCNNKSGSEGIHNLGSEVQILGCNINNCGNYGIYNSGDYVEMSNNYIEDVDTYDGIYNLIGADGCIISNNTIRTVTQHSITNVGNKVEISNNMIEMGTAGNYGIYNYTGQSVRITGNGVYQSGDHCIHVTSNTIIISNNTCYGSNSGSGIYCTSDQNTISNNTCYNNNTHGISLSTTSNRNNIVGNLCYSNTDGIFMSDGGDNIANSNICYNNSSDGIYNAGDDCVINSNRCDSNGAYGIYNNSGDYVVINGNNTRGNTSGGISDTGTGTINTDNL